MSQETRDHGQLAAAISNAVVHRLAETTGRGPTRARTTLGQDAVFVVVQDALTKGERVLVEQGEADVVLNLRHRWQQAMRDSLSNDVQQLTGRRVIGFMSDNQVDPDLGTEIFILEPADGAFAPAEGESDA